MNFMGGSSSSSSRQGFYEDDSKGTTRPFSHSSYSCPSSPASSQLLQQRGRLVPFSYHHHQQAPWNNNDSSFRSYPGGVSGANSQGLDLTMELDSSSSSPTANINQDADLESDEHHLAMRRGAGGGIGIEIGTGIGISGDVMIEREHMFDKVVTPSDVGKLNRLVIPKQHAEKYFPLDSSTSDKGLLLNFEDRNGKPWRFRYSYWNSSQSYVMTKGWSRFVKEKKLDAGDVVSFQRGVGELGKDRLFIDWRRRPDAPDHHHHHHLLQFPPNSIPTLPLPHHQFSFHHRFYLQQQQQQSSRDDHNSQLLQLNASINPRPWSTIPLRSAAVIRPQQVGVGVGHAGLMVQLQKGSGSSSQDPMVFESVPVVQGKAAAKRLRLFGVNMDCPISESTEDECAILSSMPVPHSTIPSQSHSHSHSSSISPLRMRPYSATALSSNKGKASMSLDLDI